MRMGGELRFDLRGLHPGALRLERPFGLAQGGVSLLGRGRERLVPAISVDQRAMGRCIGQRAFVVLAVDLDQRRRERAQRLGADAAVIDVGARASVRELDPPQDQLVADLDVLPFEQSVGGVPFRQFEGRRHLALRLAVAHQTTVAARAERQRQRVQKNRFPRAGLAGEDRQPGRELKIQLIDQHHVANGEARKHQGVRIRTGRPYARSSKSTSRRIPAAAAPCPSGDRRRHGTTGCRENCARAPRLRSALRR